MFQKKSLFFCIVFYSFFQLYASGTYNNIPATVLSIVDGDTVKVRTSWGNLKSVRFKGIDTPETHYLGKTQGLYGELAADHLSTLLPIGAKIDILYKGKATDNYGRLLGRIMYKGKDINLEMLKSGLACIYTIYPFEDEVMPQYIAAQNNAIKKGLGIFDKTNPIEYIPYVWRLKVSGRKPDKYVGDYYTKKFYKPSYYVNIPIAQRIFFFKRNDALAAGFTQAD